MTAETFQHENRTNVRLSWSATRKKKKLEAMQAQSVKKHSGGRRENTPPLAAHHIGHTWMSSQLMSSKSTWLKWSRQLRAMIPYPFLFVLLLSLLLILHCPLFLESLQWHWSNFIGHSSRSGNTNSSNTLSNHFEFVKNTRWVRGPSSFPTSLSDPEMNGCGIVSAAGFQISLSTAGIPRASTLKLNKKI